MTNYQKVFDTSFTNFEGEEKTLKDIINIDTDVFDLKDRFGNSVGKKMITIEGVNKIARFFKARFSKPETIDTPNKDNAQGYVVSVEVIFPNGDTHYEVGEANNINLKGPSSGYKYTMALKRAKSRALLKSSTVALDYFLTEDEITDNEDLQIQTDVSNEETLKKLQNEKFIQVGQFSLDALVLPETDNRYPNTSIIDILEDSNDRGYLTELRTLYPHNKDLSIALTAFAQRVNHDEKNQTNTLGEFIGSIHDKLLEQTIQAGNLFDQEDIGDISIESSTMQLLLEDSHPPSDEELLKNTIAPFATSFEDEIFNDAEDFLANLSVNDSTRKEIPQMLETVSFTEEEETNLKESKQHDEVEIELPKEIKKPKRGRPKKEVDSNEEIKKQPAKRGRPKKEVSTTEIKNPKRPGRPKKSTNEDQ